MDRNEKNREKNTNCDVVLVGSLGLNNQSVGKKDETSLGASLFLLNKKEYYEKLDASYKTKYFSTKLCKKNCSQKIES